MCVCVCIHTHTHTYMYICIACSLSIHPSISEYLDWFHVLTIVNYVAGNTMLYIFFQVTGFHFLHVFASTSFLFYSGGLVSKLCLTLATPWAIACQAPLSMGFSRQEYWSGLSFPSPRDLPNPQVKPRSCALQADSLPTELWGRLPHFF